MVLRFALLVAFTFAVYNANRRELGLADTLPATLLAVSLASEGDLDLDEFDAWLAGPEAKRIGVHWTSAVTRVDGHLRSSYPVGGAILAAPLFVVPVRLGWADDWAGYRMLGKLSASLMVALSAGLLWLCLLRLLPSGQALGAALVYALGTGAFCVASQALWQHGPSLLCLSLSLWFYLRLMEQPGTARALLLSTALGAAVVCRPLDAVAAIALGSLALWQAPRRALPLLAPGLGIAGLLFSYNLGVFGELGGGYMAIAYSPLMQKLHALTRDNLFDHPLVPGVMGALFAPNKGAFAYSPVLLLAPVGMWRGLREPRLRALSACLLAWCAAMLWTIGTLRTWWGGTAYGSRYFCELLVPWLWFMALGWPALARRPWLRHLAVALAVYGVAVQVVGVARWDCAWAFEPSWAEVNHERFWDWGDTEVGRCLGQLLREGPRAADF